jgi:EAL domain-containing protein (putative c-di-GMP-specific phosphodiesterase class I)
VTEGVGMTNAMVDPTIDGVSGAAHGAPRVTPELDELDRILRDELISMVYQPIVSLLDDSVVGYEALARGPVQSALSEPAAMFGTAAKHGRLKELDIACQTQAIVQAREVLTTSGHALFVNVEPELALDAAFGRDAAAQASLENLLHGVNQACPVVLELSDMYRYESPAEMIHLVTWARSMGFRIAIDDVGIEAPSLSLLPLLEPDVVKLSRSLLLSGPSADLGRVASVVRAQAERTGAAVVSTGIESIRDREFALALGATHAQGYAIGLPTELTAAPLRIRSLEPVRASYPERAMSPFQLVADRGEVRTGPRRVIHALSQDLEREAVRQGEACVLATFDRGSTFGAATRRRYEALARSCRFVCAVGPRVPEVPGVGVFGGEVGPGDAIGSEWGLVVLAPHFSAALLGRPVDEIDGERHYKFSLSYDRDIATRAARLILGKLDVDFG